jgi:hypothetical protein
LLSDGAFVSVFAVGTDVAPRFECFSLAVETRETFLGPVTAFATPRDGTAMSVLLREEYTEPAPANDSLGVVGQGPGTMQRAAKPGQILEHALACCLVAYGLLIEGGGERLAINAGWSPFEVESTTDEDQINELLSESEAVSVAQYLERYHAS